MTGSSPYSVLYIDDESALLDLCGIYLIRMGHFTFDIQIEPEN